MKQKAVDWLLEQIKEMDPEASIICGSIKRLEEQLELLQNRIK